MPFDKEPKETAAERQRIREHEARLREQKSYYQNLKDGTTVPAATPAERHPEVFKNAYSYSQLPGEPSEAAAHSNQDDDNDAPQPNPTTLNLGKTQLTDIRDAIDKRSLAKLKLVLGPQSQKAQRIARESKKNYWEWLKARCELVVVTAVEKAVYKQAEHLEFPTTVQAGQIKKAIDQVLNPIISETQTEVASWNIHESIKGTTTHYLRDLAKQEQKRWTARMSINLPEELYSLKLHRRSLETICATNEEQQETLNQQHQTLALETGARWSKFQEAMEESEEKPNGSLTSQVTQLKQSGIASLPLGQQLAGTTSALTIIDYAIQQYAQASEGDKVKLQAIVEYLLQRGATPSRTVEQYFDWDLLQTFLNTVDVSTHYRETLRDKLLPYCEKAKETAHSWLCQGFFSQWLPSFVFNQETFKIRRHNVSELAVMLCSPGMDDQGLFDKVNELLETMPRGMGDSRLEITLMDVRYDSTVRQKVLAAPCLGEETELPAMQSSTSSTSARLTSGD